MNPFIIRTLHLLKIGKLCILFPCITNHYLTSGLCTKIAIFEFVHKYYCGYTLFGIMFTIRNKYRCYTLRPKILSQLHILQIELKLYTHHTSFRLCCHHHACFKIVFYIIIYGKTVGKTLGCKLRELFYKVMRSHLSSDKSVWE